MLDPQVSLSLEIAIALVGVVEPGQGIVSAEAADEVTITFETVAHGYDAAVDVAADIEFGTGVAASASAGIAVSEAILDAAEVIDAVTDIVDEVNGIVAEDLAREEAEVSAQSGPGPTATTPRTRRRSSRLGTRQNHSPRYRPLRREPDSRKCPIARRRPQPSESPRKGSPQSPRRRRVRVPRRGTRRRRRK